MLDSIIYDFAEKQTHEEQTLANNIKALSEKYKDGFDIDISLALELFPCFGFDPESFEAEIVDD